MCKQFINNLLTIHKRFSSKKHGFSLIELLVVISIIAIIVTVSLPALRNYQRRNYLRIAGQEVKSALVEAQNMAFTPEPSIDSQKIYGYGVYFNKNNRTYILFKEKNQNPSLNQNPTYTLGLDENIKTEELPPNIYFNFPGSENEISVIFTTPLTTPSPYLKKIYFNRNNTTYDCTNSVIPLLLVLPGEKSQINVQIDCQSSRITVGSKKDIPHKLECNFTASMNPAPPGTTITFIASAYDFWDDSLTYSWDFGDGQKGTGKKIDHLFSTNGNYNVVLTVTCSEGLECQTNQIITITSHLSDCSIYVEPEFFSGSIYGKYSKYSYNEVKNLALEKKLIAGINYRVYPKFTDFDPSHTHFITLIPTCTNLPCGNIDPPSGNFPPLKYFALRIKDNYSSYGCSCCYKLTIKCQTTGEEINCNDTFAIIYDGRHCLNPNNCP